MSSTESLAIDGTIEPMVTRNKNDLLIAFSRRLNKLLDNIDYPPKNQGRQGAMAKDFGVSQKGARKWLEAESFPKPSRMMEMAEKYNVSYEWLSTGQGDATSKKPATLDVPVLSAEQVRDFLTLKTLPKEYKTIPELQPGTAHVAFGWAEESQQFEPAIMAGAIYYILPMKVMNVKMLPNRLLACWVNEHIVVGRMKPLAMGQIALLMPDKTEVGLEHGLKQVIGLVTHIHNP
ncbi:MAG: helix-turn-helix transcriptional regulator [Bermanella sp.]